MRASSQVLRFADWTSPVPPVAREVLSAVPEPAGDQPPVLFVPGLGHGAWAFAEHWLGHTAARGFAAYSVSPRADGSLRAYVHDVVQVAASLPRQAVLLGHGAGALVVAHALARYPARAAVLASPVPEGWSALGAALRTNPFGTLPALFGAAPRLSRRQLFGAGQAAAAAHHARLVPTPARVYRQVLFATPPAAPVGDPPVLVVGSPDDRVVPRKALDRTAARHGGAPLLFPGMAHDLMLDESWPEPIDAILDWLTKELAA
ncbi:alpha/beta fold hydrolase [Amorphoplanes nipponensis]|uniref:Alpha/beta hydrolase n=1 Tax=Actinoplanes nipponensis TaxID=135950 RepID=A0A919JPD4_9ACTN|nr:alpha/beta fold hydrolase [Actinoplanes nipponensis]GIE54341.1 alpha/beta hydrolase [Actinoplanes nipponensis]